MNKPITGQSWQKNLAALWFGTFMAGIGFSEVMPFLSLYIDTLGNFSPATLNLLSGITYSATYLVTALVSPWWGKLADQVGRKLMLLRAAVGLTVVFFLMGMVTHIWQLVALRLIQGVFAGYVSNANALIATQVPKAKSGQALGTLATGAVSGTLLGPLLGGSLSSIFGYRITFIITGFIFLVVCLVSLLFVHEEFEPVTKSEMLTTKEVISSIKHPRLVFGMFITTLVIQASNNSIAPILSLYVREIMHNNPAVTFLSGVVAAIPGVATLFAAPLLGRLGDRIGTEIVLMAGFIMAITLYIPMAFVTSVWQLIALRFLIGIANAAMLPAVQTLLAKNAPVEITGRIFSWNQSSQGFGNFLGPILGSVVSSVFGYSGVFISTAILVLLNLTSVFVNVRAVKKAK